MVKRRASPLWSPSSLEWSPSASLDKSAALAVVQAFSYSRLLGSDVHLCANFSKLRSGRKHQANHVRRSPVWKAERRQPSCSRSATRKIMRRRRIFHRVPVHHQRRSSPRLDSSPPEGATGAPRRRRFAVLGRMALAELAYHYALPPHAGFASGSLFVGGIPSA